MWIILLVVDLVLNITSLPYFGTTKILFPFPYLQKEKSFPL